MKKFISHSINFILILLLVTSTIILPSFNSLSYAQNSSDSLVKFTPIFNFSTNPVRFGNHNINANSQVASEPDCYDSTDSNDASNSALKMVINNTLNTAGAYNAVAKYSFCPGNANTSQQPPTPFSGDGIRLWVSLKSPIYLSNPYFRVSVLTGYTGSDTGIIDSSVYISDDYAAQLNGGFIYIPYSKFKNSSSISILDAVQGSSTAKDRIEAITGITVQFTGSSNADLANYSNLYIDSLQCYSDTTKKPQPMITNAYRSEKGFVDLTRTHKYSNIKTGSGKTLYVSQKRGNDNNTGTKEMPFKTIGKARQNNTAGDTVIVEEGIYSEKIVYYLNSGTKEQPITLMGEKGHNVTITSYDPITTDWELYREGIYKTNIGSNKDITHALWKSGGGFNNLVEARWPNADAEDILSMERAFMETGSNAQGIYDSHLPQGDWNGATAFAWTGKVYEQYVAFTRIIQNYNPGVSFTFDRNIPDDNSGADPSPTYTPAKGDWYYLTGALAGLDIEREYFYDNATGDFYVITPDKNCPADSEIWVETRKSCIENWSSEYIQFANLNIVGGGVGIDANNCTLDNVNVYYADFFKKSDGYETLHNEYNGNHLNGANNVWLNSEIAYTMSTGIFVLGNNNRIENCVIHDVAYNGGYNSAITINPEVKYTTIRRCSLYNSGRFLIQFAYGGDTNTGHQGTLIEYNDIYSADRLTQDGGAIYTYHRDGAGTIIRYNWIHDCMSSGTSGIYLDNNSKNFNVYRNVVWGIRDSNLALNTNSINNKIFNNTFLGYGDNAQGWPKNPTSSMAGTEIRNNIFTGRVDLLKGLYAPTFGVNSFDALPALDSFFVPNQNSTLVDAGVKIDGYDYEGDAPDLGAYEYGGRYWVPGAVNEYPTFQSRLGIDVTDGILKISPSDDNNFGADIEIDKLATGGTIKLYFYGEVFDSAVISLNGDLNGNGVVNAADLLLLKKHILMITDFDKYQLSAGNIDNNEKISSSDLLLLKKHILGMQKI